MNACCPCRTCQCAAHSRRSYNTAGVHTTNACYFSSNSKSNSTSRYGNYVGWPLKPTASGVGAHGVHSARWDREVSYSAACSQNTVTQNTVIWHRNCITHGKSTCVQYVLARWLATLVCLANQRASTCWTHVLLLRVIQCLCHITVIPLP